MAQNQNHNFGPAKSGTRFHPPANAGNRHLKEVILLDLLIFLLIVGTFMSVTLGILFKGVIWLLKALLIVVIVLLAAVTLRAINWTRSRPEPNLIRTTTNTEAL